MVVEVTKRLHISGLSSTLSAKDIESRFVPFGKVSHISGFGSLDANGFPRKYAYLTLQTTAENLKKCLGALSGTTWKGAKLRVGEAKLDWQERWKQEFEASSSVTAKLTTSGKNVGRQATDMSLIEMHDNTAPAGWHATPDQHLIRPMRMRPSKPLVPPVPLNLNRKKNKKVSSRKPNPPIRMRRKTIDPRRYGRSHLTGTAIPAKLLAAEIDSGSQDAESSRAPQKPLSGKAAPEATNASSTIAFDAETPSIASDQDEESNMLKDEIQRDMRIINSMFDNTHPRIPITENVEGENSQIETSDEHIASNLDHDDDDDDNSIHRNNSDEEVVKSTKLRDMFKPREEENSFAFFADDDVVMDPEIAAFFEMSDQKAAMEVTPTNYGVELQTSETSKRSTVVLNSNLPLFFPPPKSQVTGGALQGSIGGMPGRYQFSRIGTDEDIRRSWDARKKTLTTDWKKRHREAVKLRRKNVYTS